MGEGWIKDTSRYFSKEDSQRPIHISCLVIREMQINVTTQYHDIPTWIAKMKKTSVNMEQLVYLLPVAWGISNCSLYILTYLWETGWGSVATKAKLYGPSIPFQGIRQQKPVYILVTNYCHRQQHEWISGTQ